MHVNISGTFVCPHPLSLCRSRSCAPHLAGLATPIFLNGRHASVCLPDIEEAGETMASFTMHLGERCLVVTRSKGTDLVPHFDFGAQHDSIGTIGNNSDLRIFTLLRTSAYGRN